jgi:hypothetical protein
MNRTNAAWEDPEPIGSGSLRFRIHAKTRAKQNLSRNLTK